MSFVIGISGILYAAVTAYVLAWACALRLRKQGERSYHGDHEAA
jgi:hypothetical protein